MTMYTNLKKYYFSKKIYLCLSFFVIFSSLFTFNFFCVSLLSCFELRDWKFSNYFCFFDDHSVWFFCYLFLFFVIIITLTFTECLHVYIFYSAIVFIQIYLFKLLNLFYLFKDFFMLNGFYQVFLFLLYL